MGDQSSVVLHLKVGLHLDYCGHTSILACLNTLPFLTFPFLLLPAGQKWRCLAFRKRFHPLSLEARSFVGRRQGSLLLWPSYTNTHQSPYEANQGLLARLKFKFVVFGAHLKMYLTLHCFTELRRRVCTTQMRTRSLSRPLLRRSDLYEVY